MKFNYWLAKIILSLGLLAYPVNAQTPNLSVQLQPNLTLSNQERQELLRLRQEKEIRDRVQAEVDRAFSRHNNYLNILLLLIFLLPVLTGLGFWLFYRQLISRITSENKQLLTPEFNHEFFKITVVFKQEIENLKFELGEQLNQIIQQVNYDLTYQHYQNNLSVPTEEANWAGNPVENQPLVTASPTSGMSDSEVETTERIIPVTPEEEAQLQTENEESNTQPLTAEEYFNLGNNHLVEGRYAEANQCYNDAVKIDRNFPEARYQNARAYALRGNINPAIGNLQWAIDLDPKYKETAKADSAFVYIRTDEQFRQVIE